MRRRTALAAILLALIVAGGVGVVLQRKHIAPAPPALPRPVASVILDDTARPEHSVPGTIVAKIEVALGFQTLGRVTARNVDIGSVVHKGEVLATLNPDDLQGDVRAAQAAVDAAAVEMDTAKATASRTRALARRNVATTAQLEQAERALSSAIAADQQARSELIRALDAAGFAEMKAPFDGVISAVYANAGAVVSAGEPVAQLSAQEGLEAVIDLPEAALSRVRPGDRYEVWSEIRPQPARTRAGHADRTRHRCGDPHPAHPSGAGRQRQLPAGRPDPCPPRRPRPAAAAPDAHGHPQPRQPGAGLGRHPRRQGRPGRGPHCQDRAPQGDRSNDVDIVEGLAPGDEVVIRGINSLTAGQPVGRSVSP